MLFNLGHSHCVVGDKNTSKRLDGRSVASPVDDPKKSKQGTDEGYPDSFRYFFPDAADLRDDAGAASALDALADAMIAPPTAPDTDPVIPAIFTYFGQFVDHDITAGTDREAGLSIIDTDVVIPADRRAVVRDRRNLRTGSLDLDSLYGDERSDGPFGRKMADLLRHPTLRAKMWIGTPSDLGLGKVPLPADPGADLLRVDRLLREPHQRLTAEELRALPEPMRSVFVNPDDSIRVQRAMIGDSRNDENLIVAQFHLALLRFHNRVVDCAPLDAGLRDPDALHAWARRIVRWTYQWLVLNVYLPRVCDVAVVESTVNQGAPHYARLLAASARAKGYPAPMPIPLEFSTAAFRFGHSMVRPSYDWNRFFGRSAGGSTPFLDRSPFELLFAFTGNGSNPMPNPEGGSAPRLPTHWVAEWDRLAGDISDFPDRAARAIDTNLAPPLADMRNEEEEPRGLFRHLARRNLRRGHRLNIPSAQSCIAGFEAQTGVSIEPLGEDELTSGATGDALRAGGFISHTPLWFYVLKEAEIRARGRHLGPLGSLIVAETLAGLIIHDPNSYWHQKDAEGNPWHPRDGVKPSGEVVDTIPALLRAAGVL